MNWIKSRLRDYIIRVVIDSVVIGGNCGCCGKWVNNCLVPSYWRVALCDECLNETRHHVSVVKDGKVTARYIDGEQCA